MAVRHDDWNGERRNRRGRDEDDDRRDMSYAYGRYSGESEERDSDRRSGRSRADERAWRERPGRYNSGYGYGDRSYDDRGEGGGYAVGVSEPDDGMPGRWANEEERRDRYSGMGASGREVEGQYRGVGPKGYTRSDDRIKEMVCDVLMDDSHLDASRIEIAVQGGEITLSGAVTRREDKRRAEDLVERCAGGKHVQNNLRVVEANSGGESGRSAGPR